ncbi:tetratricopeptide repeat protein [Cytobacillus sp. FJAT-54145]|uniref:Tetratricopeptide repeat protein n=1 Tax=Cytobacillus spartinae TaxID=3299023 RepID=A0ABW6KDZ6_9BACI
MNKNGIIVILAALLLAGGAGYWFFFKEEPKENNPKTEEVVDETESNKEVDQPVADTSSQDSKLLEPFYQAWSIQNLDEAENIINTLVKEHPQNVRFHLEAANLYFSKDGSPDRSIQLLEAFTKNSKDVQSWNELGYYYILMYKAEFYPKAVDTLKTALNLAAEQKLQDVAFIQANYAQALTLNGQAKEAIAIYEQEVFKAPEDTFKHLQHRLNYAIALQVDGQSAKAIQVLQDILAIDENSIQDERVKQELPYTKDAASEVLQQFQG